jgi:hypothetical protein
MVRSGGKRHVPVGLWLCAVASGEASKESSASTKDLQSERVLYQQYSCLHHSRVAGTRSAEVLVATKVDGK